MSDFQKWAAIIVLVIICVGSTYIIIQSVVDLALAVLKLTAGL